MSAGLRTQVGQLARRSVAAHPAPAGADRPGARSSRSFLLAVNSGGLKDATNLPGFPTDSYLTFALAVPFMQGALFSVMNAGTDLARDIETGFLNRLALTPLRGAALLSGLLAGAVVLGARAGGRLPHRRPAPRRRPRRRASAARWSIVALSVSITVAFGSLGLFAALRTGSGEAVQGLFPVFFVFLFLSSMALPRNLIQTDWFHASPPPTRSPTCSRPSARCSSKAGTARRWRSASAIAAADPRDRHVRGRARPEDEAGADVSAVPRLPQRSPCAVAWRSIHNFLTNPAFLVPALVFPLFFFISFAGGLSAIGNVARLRLPQRLHRLPVRLRPAPVGGLRRRLHRLRDRPRLRDRLRPPLPARRRNRERDRRRLRDRRADPRRRHLDAC